MTYITYNDVGKRQSSAIDFLWAEKYLLLIYQMLGTMTLLLYRMNSLQ